MVAVALPRDPAPRVNFGARVTPRVGELSAQSRELEKLALRLCVAKQLGLHFYGRLKPSARHVKETPLF